MLRIASICTFLYLAFAPLVTSTANAQVALRAQMQGSQTGRFIEAPRSVLQQIREAQRAIDEKTYSDAVVRLGDLLAGDSERMEDEDLAGQDFLLDIHEPTARDSETLMTNSLLRSARDQIGSLPASALETYRLRYGPLASRLLDQAAKDRDWNKVREVRRRYFHTFAGYEASALLAQQEMYSGHPLAVSLLLDDVVANLDAVRHLGAGIVVLHAAACRHAGRELPSIDSIADQPIIVGDQSHSIPSADDLEPWLISLTGEPKTLSGGMTGDYPVFGTDPDRNGGSAGQMPMTNKRWDLVTTASPRQERDIREATDVLVASGKLPPPSWMPIRIGNHLLMRTTERLVGVDYRTGKRVWTYPWQTTSAELNNDEQSLDALEDEQAIGDLLKQRVWNDIPYGQITSDGQRVFMLDSLQQVELVPYGALQMRGTRPADGRSNTLVALDLETEGKLLWRLGAGVGQETELSDAFFLGPPLPLDGRLYVIAELAGDISLFCLDAQDGSELWRQQLVAVESGGIETDAIRRIAGAMPTYRDGIMICPTGAGAVVAIDLADRMIRWGVSYNRNIGLNQALISRGRAVDGSQLMQRWHSGTAIISDSTVFVTPIEADRLYGLDLITGKNRFAKQNRYSMRYLAGARENRFFVVGTTQMRAFDQRNGKVLWTSPSDMLESGQLISGIGVFGDGEYLLPTSTNEIIRVGLQDGKVLGRRKTRYPLGNLVAAGGEIVSQGPTKLSVAFGEQSLEPTVNRRLAQNPDDVDALIRKSELLIERKDREQALVLLERARQLDDQNVEIRMLYVTAMLGQLRDDPSMDSELIQRLDEQIERPDQRVEYLSLLTRAALEQQQFVVAVERLVELTSLLQSSPLLDPSVKEVSDQSGRWSTLDDWIAARLSDIETQASDADRSEINRQLIDFSEVKRHESTSYLEQMVRQFGPWNGIDTLRQELMQRLNENSEYLKMERLALGTRSPSDDQLAAIPADRLLSLASVYLDGGLPKDALKVIQQLTKRDPDSNSDRVDQIRRAAEAEISDFSWPETATLQWEPRRASIHNMAYNQRASVTKIQSGQQFEGWALVSEATSSIALRDPTGLVRGIRGNRNQQQNRSDKEAQISGGFMAIVSTRGLTGVDLFRLQSGDSDAVLWDRTLGDQSTPMARRQSDTNPFNDQEFRYLINAPGDVQNPPEFKLGPIIGDRLIVLQGGELVALDVFTSTTLWRNSNAPKNGVIVFDGNQVAVVSTKSKRVDLFDVMDGRKVDSKPWVHEKVWEATESHVLSYQQRADKTTIKLVNPFSGEVLLQTESVGANRGSIDKPSAYGRVVDGTYMALMGSDGQAIVWNLREAVEVANVKLTPYPDLQDLQVVLLKDQIVLLPRRRQLQPQKRPTPQLRTQIGQNHTTVDGAHSISLSDGNLKWHHDFDQAWGCTLSQPAETPLLMFSRSYTTNNIATRSRRMSIEILPIAVSNGTELHPAKRKPVKENVNALETHLIVDASNARVAVNMGPEQLTYQFGDDDQTVAD